MWIFSQTYSEKILPLTVLDFKAKVTSRGKLSEIRLFFLNSWSYYTRARVTLDLDTLLLKFVRVATQWELVIDLFKLLHNSSIKADIIPQAFFLVKLHVDWNWLSRKLLQLFSGRFV